MKIATWNLKNNNGADVWGRLHTNLGADLMFLQESRKPDWSGGLAWENVPHHDWGSAVITSKGDISPTTVKDYEGWVVGGELIDSELNHEGRPLYVFSIHAPTSNPTQPRQSYVEEVVKILDMIKGLVTPRADLILGGDFNFLSLGHRNDCESMKTTLHEKEALACFNDLQLVSCWATAHPGQPLAQTLRWSGDKSPGRSTPYHCDGIFVPSRWQSGISCEILTSACFEISDHNPVMAWISQ